MSGITRSMPKSSDSGNIIPASMTMMSSPQRSAIMFMPNSPRPPRGIARRDCRDVLNEMSAPRATEKSYHSASSARLPRILPFWLTDEQPGNGHQNHCAGRGGRQRIEEIAVHDAEVVEEPAPNDRADQAEHNIGDTTKAAAAECYAGDPSGQKAGQDPRPEAVRTQIPDGNANLLNRENCSGRH